MFVPLVDLRAQYHFLKADIDRAIAAVINEGAFIGGRYVSTFEDEFASACGARHCVSVANGTDAIYIILRMLSIGPGDEVITVANSWISSSETITQAGARPVFIDINPAYHSIDEDLLEGAITDRTKAVIAVHLQGQMCAIDKIEQICKRYGLMLIEDCAQAHFSAYDGRLAGLTGVAGSFSFYPGKNLGAYGDAGCIITNDDSLAERCRMFARHGALKKHHHQIEGVNSRLDGLQAAILLTKLPHINAWNEARVSNAARYESLLSGTPGIVTPKVRPNSRHTFHLYVIRAERRDELALHLDAKGVKTAIHYPTPLPLLPAYRYLGKSAADFPVAARFMNEILSLPMYPELTREQMEYVAQQVRGFYGSL